MPHLAKQVDDIALIRSMHTTNLTHEPAIYLIHTGKMGPGRPSIGSWVVYGLGSENQNLPAYVVLDDPLGLPINGVENWQSGFLPPLFQGTRFKATGSPVLNLRPEVERPADVIAMERDLLARLDAATRASGPAIPNSTPASPATSWPPACRWPPRTPSIWRRKRRRRSTSYGIGKQPTESYGRRCLIARRLVERGVRFVQLYINAQIWDNHTSLAADLKTGLRPNRSADRRPLKRPETAGAAGQHAGDLGGRIRPIADRPVAQRQERKERRPRSQQERLLHVVRGRGNQSAAQCTARPTNWGLPPWKTKSAFPTGTRRSCTCWGSITKNCSSS